MRLTDEMVEAAYATWQDAVRSDSFTGNLEGIRAALEAALSHAAGQEAVAFRFVADGDAYNPFKPEWFDGTPEPHDLDNAKRFPGVRVEYAYLTPAATTNPAEIGRKSVGGEAVAPFAWGYLFPHDGETDHCLSMARFLPSWVEAKGATEHPLYLTPAQPPASAERDAVRMDWLDKGGTIPVNNYRRVEARGRVIWATGIAKTARAAIDAAMAASSGRNESPIAGVTHGTDEGWGDE